MGDASSLFFSGIYHIIYIYTCLTHVAWFSSKMGMQVFKFQGLGVQKTPPFSGLYVIHTHWGKSVPCMFHVSYTRWWFQTFFVFTPIWGRFPF